MANKVVFGLKNVHIAMITDEATPTYDTPVAIPGAVKLGLGTEGGLTTFYADNMAYYVTSDNNGYAGDLDMALVSDAVLADLLGWEVDDSGLLVEISDAQPAAFALLFEVDGDVAKKRYAFYKCVASRPKEDHETKGDKTAPSTTPLTITVTPIEIDDHMVVKGAFERAVANATAFDAFYDAVLIPSFSVS